MLLLHLCLDSFLLQMYVLSSLCLYCNVELRFGNVLSYIPDVSLYVSIISPRKHLYLNFDNFIVYL
jgi:hypothetical protein